MPLPFRASTLLAAAIATVLGAGSAAAFTPNDPRFGSQTNLQRIGMPSAWDTTFGDQRVRVAVLGTGVDYSHPDIAQFYRADLSYDFVNNDADPADDNGHGTHMAGIIAAHINNGVGVAGIAPSVSLMAVKVLGADGSGTYDQIADGLRWAASHGAHVIYMTLGSTHGDSNPNLDAALSEAAATALLIAPSGNDSGPVVYPADRAVVLAVGGTATETNARASFSNFGPELDLAAPATDIVSLYRGSYASLSGTTMAGAHVAGVAGLVFAIDPSRTAAQVRDILLGTAQDIGTPGRDDSFGAGLVRADLAVAVAGPSPAGADLEVSITDSPDPVAPGAYVTYTVNIVNHGPEDAHGVSLSATVVGAQLGAEDLLPPITCGPSRSSFFSCLFATLPNGATTTVTFRAAAPATGSVSVTADVRATETDPRTTDNHASAQTTVSTPSADLAVSITDSPDPVAPGGYVSYAITVTNRGPADAHNVSVSAAVSGAATGAEDLLPYPNCGPSRSSFFSCLFATLPSGASTTVTFRAAAPASGTISVTADVRATEPDPSTADNHAAAETAVATPPPPPPSACDLDLQSCTADLGLCTAARDNLASAVSTAVAQLDLQTALGTAQSQLGAAQSQLGTAQSQLGAALSMLSSTQSQLTSAQNALAACQVQNASATSDLLVCRRDLSAAQARLAADDACFTAIQQLLTLAAGRRENNTFGITASTFDADPRCDRIIESLLTAR